MLSTPWAAASSQNGAAVGSSGFFTTGIVGGSSERSVKPAQKPTAASTAESSSEGTKCSRSRPAKTIRNPTSATPPAIKPVVVGLHEAFRIGIGRSNSSSGTWTSSMARPFFGYGLPSAR